MNHKYAFTPCSTCRLACQKPHEFDHSGNNCFRRCRLARYEDAEGRLANALRPSSNGSETAARTGSTAEIAQRFVGLLEVCVHMNQLLQMRVVIASMAANHRLQHASHKHVHTSKRMYQHKVCVNIWLVGP